MTSEEEERPRFVMGGYGRHRHQWVKQSVVPEKSMPPSLPPSQRVTDIPRGFNSKKMKDFAQMLIAKT